MGLNEDKCEQYTANNVKFWKHVTPTIFKAATGQQRGRINVDVCAVSSDKPTGLYNI
jgi:hypothetical protein